MIKGKIINAKLITENEHFNLQNQAEFNESNKKAAYDFDLANYRKPQTSLKTRKRINMNQREEKDSFKKQ